MSDRPQHPDHDHQTELAAALNELSEPLLALDREQRLYYANHAAQQLLAISAERLPQDLATALAERQLAQTLLRAAATTDGDHGPASDEFLWRRDQHSYAVRIQPVANGHLILFLQATPKSPLNDRLVSEYTRRFWATALAGIGSWTWDVGNQRLRSDSILSAFTGPDSDRSVPAEIMLEHVHPEDRAGLQQALQQAVAGAPGEQETDIDVAFRFVPLDGQEIWLAMRGGLIRDANGEPLMLAGVHFDITGRKRAEQALLQTKQALEEANRAKDGFLAKLSHEIRTPLTAILGYADLLLSRAASDQDRWDLEQVLASGRYLQRLVDDLLDLSRIIAGKITIERQALDLRHIGEELLSSIHLRAAAKGLACSVEIDPQLPARIATDPVRVRQVLHNLLENAVKFTRQGELSLRIAARRTGAAAQIAFEVRDTGPGIARDKLHELFEPFAQTRRSDVSQHGGLGLGLAISQRLATMLGGEIEVETRTGAGSRFTLVLPLVERPVESPPQADDAAESAPSSPLPALRARILVVDDVDSIRGLLCAQLVGAGAEVTTARDGEQALNRIIDAERAATPFDLLLLDLYLPGLDGYQLLQRLRRVEHHLPVIALSASAMKGERERALDAGFAEFISKPFTPRQLLDGVAAVLSRNESGVRRESRPGPIDTLLLVEDHDALAELTARQLSSLGYRVELASSGAAAIDRARALTPAAMVIDLSLPDMDGIDLCRALRQDDRLGGCRMIAYTGREEPEERDRARRAGFDEVLLKPAQTADFAAALRIEL